MQRGRRATERFYDGTDKNTKEFEKALSASEKLLAEYKKEERILQKDVTETILKLTEEQGKLEEKAYVIATSSNGKTGRVEITVVSKDTVSNPESPKDEGKG